MLVLRLREGSILSAGLPCSSFVFLNSHTSGRRTWRPLGFASLRPYVRTANVNLDFQIYRICSFSVSAVIIYIN